MAVKWKILNPLSRNSVNKPLDVGVRAINNLMTRKGQRMVLLLDRELESLFAWNDVQIYRGRNSCCWTYWRARQGSRQFCKKYTFWRCKGKTIVVAVPADRSPLLRIRGANRATAIAEYFRSIGRMYYL